MHPTETFQLSIEFKPSAETPVADTKEDVKNWLLGVGEESFVEGAIDQLFLDLDYGASASDQYDELGGDSLPLMIYKYNREHLLGLQRELEARFPKLVQCKLDSLQTETWMEGWKESFKPIRTQHFYIYPPWLADGLPTDRIPLVIEPGMAFGTGQHATTVLCLEAIESLPDIGNPFQRVLDVGTGTGILSIAASKLGCGAVTATDIDPDAMIAARDNAAANAVDLQLVQGTFPSDASPYQVVIANIIFYVLKQIIPQLAEQTAGDGYLILSGLLAEEAPEMATRAAACGLQLWQESIRDDWACQVYRKI